MIYKIKAYYDMTDKGYPDKFPMIDRHGDVWADNNHFLFELDSDEINPLGKDIETIKATDSEIKIYYLYKQLHKL